MTTPQEHPTARNGRKDRLLGVAVTLVIVVSLSVVAGYQYYLSPQRYPGVIDPAGAYLLPNGTLYLAVYNSWDRSVTVDSLQVALANMSSIGAHGQVYSGENYPNTPLGDGAVRLYLTHNGFTSSTIESKRWTGGGNVTAGGVALLRFEPSERMSLNKFDKYYVAVGNQWLPSANLEPFVFTNDAVRDSLPASIPVRAVVYPNETMNVAVISPRPSQISSSADVLFSNPSAGAKPLNATYSVKALGSDWYHLAGGENLPPFMPLSINTGPNSNYTSFTIHGIVPEILRFDSQMVTQIPPIVAGGVESSSSWSSGGCTQGYAVQWQFQANGKTTFRFPLTLYSGKYELNANNAFRIGIGNLSLTTPAASNISYYSGEMVATLLNPKNASGTLTILLSFGPAPTISSSGTLAARTITIQPPAAASKSGCSVASRSA